MMVKQDVFFLFQIYLFSLLMNFLFYNLKNDKMIITAEFAKMSRKLIAAGITCPTKAKETIKMNFKGDEIFRDVFPIIFNIELCKLKLKAPNA